MCGIVGRVGSGDAVNELITGLESLEYRGYDSAGVAIQNGKGIVIQKRAGEISEMKDDIATATPSGNIGIGHTRWSTHGPPTDENAHPHTSQSGDVAVVHNGIIENYQELRERLQAEGHEFTSDTDTEVVPHLVEHHRENASDPEQAFRRAVDEIDGSYAIAAIVDGTDTIYAARNGSPLIVGIGDDEYYLASDVPAFLEHTDDVVYLEDGDIAVLEPSGVNVTTPEGVSVSREIETVDWDPEEVGKGTYDHYMLKEIHTQPNALSNTIRGRIDRSEETVTIDDIDRDIFEGVERIQFIGCGTSYHAALQGARLMNEAGINAHAYRASEYIQSSIAAAERTLAIAVTQSGETADTLTAIRRAAKQGVSTLAVTNVVGSTITRETDETAYIRAGPEIGVAATKTFTSQAVTLVLLSQLAAEEVVGASPREDLDELLGGLERLPEDVDELLAQNQAADLARDLLDNESYFFIGRGLSRSVALEGALKFKEITYEHAEGFASGQLKHGPLALVTPETPVFALFTDDRTDKTLTNAKEAQTRGATIVAVSPDDHAGRDMADEHLSIPDTHPVCQGLLANVQLQLVSYYTADLLDRAIDKPRNLAKSVTVE